MKLNFNLNHIITFIVVAETSSFRAAAERLNISQSVVSLRIKNLEERLGVPLLHRTTRSVTLTNEGSRLLAVARGMSADMERVAAELREEATLQRGDVTVSAMPTIAASLMPSLMAKFRRMHPGVRVRLIDIDTQRTLELMRYGTADIGLVADVESAKNIEFTPLFWDECFFVVKDGPALPARGKLRLADTLAYPLLVSPQGSRFREMVEDCFAAHSLAFAPAQEAWNMQTLAALVRQGHGGAFMPKTALDGLKLSGCRVIRIAERIGRTVGVARVISRADSPAVAAFRAFICREMGTRAGD
jgi:DNA-binding transcriptional LysR family regulator